jgi:hypothetical protein
MSSKSLKKPLIKASILLKMSNNLVIFIKASHFKSKASENVIKKPQKSFKTPHITGKSPYFTINVFKKPRIFLKASHYFIKP